MIINSTIESGTKYVTGGISLVLSNTTINNCQVVEISGGYNGISGQVVNISGGSITLKLTQMVTESNNKTTIQELADGTDISGMIIVFSIDF